MTDPLSLNLRHLLMINAIGQTGSITAACELVHLSQPALTQGLANIEAVIGCPLFDRQHNGVSPNAAGRILIARLSRASAFFNEGSRPFRRIASGSLASRTSMAQLRALVSVAAHGGFALAARATGLSQPSIHRAARELEEVVGQTLFQRSGRTVQLTPSAIRLTQFVRLALAELRSGLAEIDALRIAGAGHVVIGAMPLARAALVPRAVAQFCEVYNTATVSIIEGPYAELLLGLRNGEIDFLLGALRDPLPSLDIAQYPLFEDRLIIAGRRGHPLAGVQPGIADLARYPWVISHQETPLRRHWEAVFAHAGHPLPLVRVECSSVIAIRGLLLEGDWLTLLSPNQMKVEKNAGILVEIGESLSNSQRWIGMTTRRDWHPTAAQQAMVDLFCNAANPEIE